MGLRRSNKLGTDFAYVVASHLRDAPGPHGPHDDKESVNAYPAYVSITGKTQGNITGTHAIAGTKASDNWRKPLDI